MELFTTNIDELLKTRGQGVYLAEVTSATEGIINEKPYINLRFVSVEKGKRGDFLCFDRLYFSENARLRSFRALVALGVAPSVKELPKVLEAKSLVGKRCLLVVKEDDYRDIPELVTTFNGYHAPDAKEAAAAEAEHALS